MNRRKNEGGETIARLRDWDRGAAASERLAAQILRVEGYKSVDPSHPLGGPDGLKDVVCERQGGKWIGAAYFPRGQQPFSAIARKFKSDFTGMIQNQANGLAFVTNQELTLSERQELSNLGQPYKIEVLHLERIASILDSPACYGIRLEFLDIEMTKEEQLAFIATRDAVIDKLQETLELLLAKMENIANKGAGSEGSVSIPLHEIKEFRSMLDSVAGSNPYAVDYLGSGNLFGTRPGHVSALKVPLTELREFAQILDRITGAAHEATYSTAVGAFLTGAASGHIGKLHVPIKDLEEYEAKLDRIIAKCRGLPRA